MRRWLTLLFLAWSLLVPGARAQTSASPPVARQGVMDLRSHDFVHQPTVELRGTWRFHWQRLLTPEGLAQGQSAPTPLDMEVPGFWNEAQDLPAHGFATYTLRILLPPGLDAATPMALKVTNTSTAFRLWVDGREVFTNGQVGTGPDTEVPYWHPGVVTLVPQGPQIDLVMQVSNFHYRKGGMWRPMVLGLAPAMHKAWAEHDQFDLMIIGALLVIALGQLGLFALRPSDRSALYFGLFCIVVLLRTAFVGDHLVEQRWPGFPFEWARKAEYLAVCLGPLILCTYFRTVFASPATPRWSTVLYRLLTVFSAACSVFVVLFSVRWYNHLVVPMQLGVVVSSLWSLHVIVLAARRKDYRAYAVLLTAFVFIATVINDVLFSRGMIASDYVAPLGFAFFLLVQDFLTARDYALSHRKTAHAEREQRRSFDLLANVQRKAGIGIWQLDPAQDRVLWSATIYQLVGLAAPEQPDVPMGFAGALPSAVARQYIHPDDRSAYHQFVAERLRARRSAATHYRLVCLNGDIRHVYAEVHLEIDPQGAVAYLYGFVQDVTEKTRDQEALKRMNAELEQQVALRTGELRQINTQLVAQNAQLQALSVTDRLTGLYNRLRLDQVLEDELARFQRYGVAFALVLVDVDHFKAVNDTHGHAVGDQVLRQFADILRNNTRAVDLVGRWGGEEFLVICRETQFDGALALAEKLRQDVSGFTFSTVGQRTASFGVTSAILGDTVAKMMARADAALYRAKAAGRNRVAHKEG